MYGILECNIVCLCRQVFVFRRNFLPPSSGYNLNISEDRNLCIHGCVNLKSHKIQTGLFVAMKAVRLCWNIYSSVSVQIRKMDYF